jgi:hypothetical protein
VREARARLLARLGRQAVLRVDPATGAPRVLARRDGFLTGPDSRRAGDIARGFLEANADSYGIDPGDLETLEPVRERRWRAVRQVRFEQRVAGIPVLAGSVSANVSTDGQLINVVGAPQPDPPAAPEPPLLDAREALRVVLASVGVKSTPPVGVTTPGPTRATSFADGASASLVIAGAGPEARSAWTVLAQRDSQHVYSALVDARSGELLARRDLVRRATGIAHDNYPGAPRGGAPSQRTLPTTGPDPWLTAPFNRLRGDNAHVYSDEKDDRYTRLDGSPPPLARDEVRPSSGSGTAAASFAYSQRRIFPTPEYTTKMLCPNHPVFGCSWDNWDTQRRAYSWRFNRDQAATQAFWFVNRFHDHLEQDPGIRFDDAAGNFEQSSSGGVPGDPVHVQVVDGADTDPGAPGFPDSEHTNNASMVTLPDGRSPVLQLNLFSNLPTRSASVRDVNSADEAAIVYHEYAHGLSDRLVCCTPDGLTTISGAQGDALAEAWSDWYALDLLEQQGLVEDGPSAGLRFGVYTGAALRTQPLDCPAGVASAACPGTQGAGGGGYTYGDFGKIAAGDEPHADGEIFGAALWDLRSILIGKHGRQTGIARARTLVTGAMVLLGGTAPDFLDVRDAIRQVAVTEGFTDAAAIASVFTARGMGDNAASSGATDTTPSQGFANGLATAPDADGDGHSNAADNCSAARNLDQANADGDSQGDACDANDDTDSRPDTSDNCRTDANEDQASHDTDGLGDACDPDDDEDALLDARDNCRTAFNPTQADSDGDGQGNACDPDVDGDGVSDRGDNCPGALNPDQRDSDRDGLGDACDAAGAVVTPPAIVKPPLPAAPAKAGFRRSARRVRVDRLGRFSYTLSAGARLRASAAFRSLRPRRTLATRRFTVPASKRARLRLRLSRRDLATLKRRRKLTVVVAVRLTNAARRSSRATARLTLLAPRRR